MTVKKGMTIRWTLQGGPVLMHYSADLFCRRRRCIIGVIHSESLLDLKRAVRETWGRLRPGRLLLISRHVTNIEAIGPGWLESRKLTFRQPFVVRGATR